MSGSNPTNQVSYAIGIDSQSYPLLRDATGALIVTGSGSGGSSNVNLVAVGGSPFLLGQSTMANSIPVVLASNQSSVPVTLSAGTLLIGHVITDTGSTTSVSNFPATQAVTQSTSPWVVSGTVTTTPPANASTNLTQVGGAAISEGQQVMASSLPVVIASNQSAIAVTGTITTSPNVNVHDGSGNTIASTGTSLNVDVTNTVPVTLTSTTVTGNVTVVQPTGTNLHTVLDSGTLTSITNALPAGTNVIGHVISDSGSTTAVTGNVTVVQPTGTNLHVVVDSAPSTVVTGTVTANQGTANTATNKWPMELVDSGGVNIASVTAANALKVDGSAVTQPISGTVTITPSGTQTVAGNKSNNSGAPGSTNLGVLPAIANAAAPLWSEGDQVLLSVDVSGILRTKDTTIVTQGSTTSGQFGPLVQGAVSTAAPTYSTSQTSPLSLNLSGGLRVDGSGVTQPVSGTVTANAGTGTFTVGQATGTNLHTVIDSGTTTVTQATGTNLHTVVDSGTITAVTAITNALPAGTNVIGHVITDTGSTTAVTGTVTVSLASTKVESTSVSSALADNQANANFFASSAGVNNVLCIGQWAYGGAFSGTTSAGLTGWSKVRVPTIFKTVSVAATATGNTAIWTPAASNKFRLLGYQISAQGLSATATAAITVSFQDNTTPITFGTHDVDVPAVVNIVSGVTQISGGQISLGGFGILSAAANNVLNFNISAAGAGTTGTYRINVMGTEE